MSVENRGRRAVFGFIDKSSKGARLRHGRKNWHEFIAQNKFSFLGKRRSQDENRRIRRETAKLKCFGHVRDREHFHKVTQFPG